MNFSVTWLLAKTIIALSVPKLEHGCEIQYCQAGIWQSFTSDYISMYAFQIEYSPAVICGSQTWDTFGLSHFRNAKFVLVHSNLYALRLRVVTPRGIHMWVTCISYVQNKCDECGKKWYQWLFPRFVLFLSFVVIRHPLICLLSFSSPFY